VVNAALVESSRGIVEKPQELVAAMMEFAKELSLMAYDTSYVYYPRLRKSKLVMRDKEILNKARDIAIEVND